jgi:exonuclease III
MSMLSSGPGLRLISWNMAHSRKAWPFLLADMLPDIALLQEALKPPQQPFWSSPPLRDDWCIYENPKEFGAAVLGLTDRVQANPLVARRLGDYGNEEMAISLPGTLAGAEVILPTGEKLLVFSAYSRWEKALDRKTIYADASAHRIISDISALVAIKKGQKIIVAGDWNILYGYGELGSAYWKARYDSVFSRMEALGMPFIGPQHPEGIQADPWPSELPADSKNVPTFRKNRNNPTSAERQLDFVFASHELHSRMTVRALNASSEWGPSDHCRIMIELW